MARLILGRNVGQSVLIGDNIRVKIDSNPKGGGLRLVIECPRDMKIMREELVIKKED